MATLVWAVLCTKATVDKESNNVSLTEVLEQIQVYERPVEARVMLSRMADLVCTWIRTVPDQPERQRGRFEYVSPDEEHILSVEFDIDLETTLRHRTIGQISGIPAKGPGIYKFLVQLANADGGWHVVGNLPLEIEYKEHRD